MSSQQRNIDQEKHNKWLRSQSKATINKLAGNSGELMREKDMRQLIQPESKNALHPSSGALDAIARAIKKHPGLTREDAQEIVDAFGF